MVDDNPDIRETYTRVFAKFGYEVIINAADAETLIDTIKGLMARGRKDYESEMVLMDYNLGKGKMNGLKGAQEVIKLVPSAKIIIVSGDLGVRDLVLARGFEFVAKPFSIAAMAHLTAKH